MLLIHLKKGLLFQLPILLLPAVVLLLIRMIIAAKIISNLNLRSRVLMAATTEITITQIIINSSFHLAIYFQIYGQGTTESLKHKKRKANSADMMLA
uniref:Uncharacterized protein n=1 Tax=Arundo donax TaxID=35708 RepID=A0A0A9DJN7_ARUDO